MAGTNVRQISMYTVSDTMNKSSKWRNIGTKQSEPRFTNTSDIVGCAFNTGGYFIDTNTTSMVFNGEFTVVFWVKSQNVGNAQNNYNNDIIVHFEDDTVFSMKVPTNVVLTDWNQVSIVRDSLNVVTVYINGVAIDSQSISASLDLLSKSYIYFGSADKRAVGFDLICDDIVIYGKAMDFTTPSTDYINVKPPIMVLVIKANGEVWGYADDGSSSGGGQ